MKALIAALLTAGAVAAEPPREEFMQGDVLQAEITRVCADGCIVLSPDEAKAMREHINTLLRQATAAAFKAGKRASDETCRNRIFYRESQ